MSNLDKPKEKTILDFELCKFNPSEIFKKIKSPPKISCYKNLVFGPFPSSNNNYTNYTNYSTTGPINNSNDNGGFVSYQGNPLR